MGLEPTTLCLGSTILKIASQAPFSYLTRALLRDEADGRQIVSRLQL